MWLILGFRHTMSGVVSKRIKHVKLADLEALEAGSGVLTPKPLSYLVRGLLQAVSC